MDRLNHVMCSAIMLGFFFVYNLPPSHVVLGADPSAASDGLEFKLDPGYRCAKGSSCQIDMVLTLIIWCLRCFLVVG